MPTAMNSFWFLSVMVHSTSYFPILFKRQLDVWLCHEKWIAQPLSLVRLHVNWYFQYFTSEDQHECVWHVICMHARVLDSIFLQVTVAECVPVWLDCWAPDVWQYMTWIVVCVHPRMPVRVCMHVCICVWGWSQHSPTDSSRTGKKPADRKACTCVCLPFHPPITPTHIHTHPHTHSHSPITPTPTHIHTHSHPPTHTFTPTLTHTQHVPSRLL